MRYKKILLIIILSFSILIVSACQNNKNEDVYDGIEITFNVGESKTIVAPIRVEVGEKIEAPLTNPILENHIFIGWYYDNKPYIFNKMPEESIELLAKFQDITGVYHQRSTLPQLYINLNENLPLTSVEREDYVKAQITLQSDNQEHLVLAQSAEFRGRGHGSWTDSGPKRGYRVKFSNKISMMGEPSSKHWVLLAGTNFNDETLFKAVTAFNMARDVMSYIEYTTSTNWVELYVNQEYRGVYMLMEHVRVDKNRVNIKSEYGVLDTGYLIELDAYAKEDGPKGIYYFDIEGVKHPFAVKSPDPDDYLDEGMTEQQFRDQIDYIKTYTQQVFNAALSKDSEAFKKVADINSFIDMYLLHELFKNTDTGWSSFYMFKKPGGKLYAGPAWDFDASAGASRGDSAPEGFYVSDTVRHHSNFTSSELFISLMEIPEFRQLAFTRWQELSPKIKTFVPNVISNQFLENNKFAFGRNFQFWASDYYGGSTILTERENKWISDSKKLREWLLTRTNWLDNASW